MSDPARVAVLVSSYQPDLDPARVWAVVGDPSQIGAWSPFRDLAWHLSPATWHPETVAVGDRFGATVGRREASCRVSSYEAGRRFAIEADVHGEPFSFEVRVHSVVASGAVTTQIEMKSWVPASRWTVGFVRWRRTRLLQRCLRDLVGLVG